MKHTPPRSRRHRNPPTPKGERQKPFFPKSNTLVQTKEDQPFFQPKLTIGQPGDQYEREADAVANQVVNGQKQQPVVQRQEISSIQQTSLATPQEEEKPVQMQTEEQEEPLQMQSIKEEEKPVQMQNMEDEEQPLQMQAEEEEEPVQIQAQEEKSVQMKPEEEEEPLQMKAEEEEKEPIQMKAQAPPNRNRSSQQPH